MSNARSYHRLAQWDKRHVWHPFTQQADWEKQKPMIIRSARGAFLKDFHGRSYLDAVSSLWVTVHGHQEPAIDRAIVRQLRRMAHTTFLGLSHEPAIRLARELARIAPGGLTRVFYSDNGSTSVEVALKMAYQYHVQTSGKERTEFLALGNSYHGDTLGSVSVGGIRLFHSKFKPLLFKASFAASPYCYRCPHRSDGYAGILRTGRETVPRAPCPGELRPETNCRWQCLSHMEDILRSRSKRLAAIVIEPIVQGAAGMIVAPPGYLKGVERLCRKHNVLLIADEVATGFGRTGRMFAVEHEGVRPDFLCVAKSLTGGYLPLAATLTSERIYRAFLGRFDQFKTFFHGHTYTANPLGCAAALANLRLYRTRDLLQKNSQKTDVIGDWLRSILCYPAVGDVRQIGMMAGVELVADKETGRCFAPHLKIGQKVCLAARKFGIWARPLGDTLVILPPLGIPTDQLRRLLSGFGAALVAVVGRPGCVDRASPLAKGRRGKQNSSVRT